MFCKIILPSNEIHKLPAVPKTYDDLYQTAIRKFKGKIPDKFYFKYKDSDDELITLSSDEDFETAIVTSEADKVKTLRIFLIPEGALAHVNPNSYLPNLMPASQESYSTENFLDKNMKGKNPAREPIAQGYGKKSGDYLEGIEEFDINRLVEQLPGVDRLKKSQSHPPQIESQEEMSNVGYERPSLYDGSKIGSPFNQDQMNVISDMLERKLKEKVEQRVHIAVNEIMGKLNEEFRPKPVKKNPYTHNPLMSKSVVPGFSSKPVAREPVMTREPVVRAEKIQPDMNEYSCINCRKKIEEVKYSCLDCQNYDLCDQCEEKVEHPHSLLKTRLNKKSRPSMDLSDASSISQHQSVPVPQPVHDAGRYSGLMASKQSQSNSFFKEESGPYSATKNMANNSLAPGANQLIRFSNSIANINFPDKAETHNPYQAKNMSTFWNNKGMNQMNMAQSMTYSAKKETPKGFDTPGGEVKKYKAAIVKPPIYDLINVKPGHIYRVEFTIKNNGTEAWPETIKLLCINGVHKGTEEVLPALAPTEKFEVKLALKAPEEPNRYLSQWRLQYYEDGTPKPFGSNLFIEINVAEGHKNDNRRDSAKEPKEPKEQPKEPKEDEKKAKVEKVEKVENVESVEKVEKVETIEKVEKAEKEVEKKSARKEVNKEANKEANKKLENVGSPKSGVKEKTKENENDKERVKPIEVEKPSIQTYEVKERVKPSVEELPPIVEEPDKSGFTPEERRLMKEKKCSEVVLRHAQALHSIYPDIEIEKQIDFVAECPIHLDINDIVMVYSTRVDQGFGMNF